MSPPIHVPAASSHEFSAVAANAPAAGPTSIEGSRCRACDYLHAPARHYRCMSCGGRDLEPTRVALRGTIETFTQLKAAEDGVALVRLDAGPRITATLYINGVPPQMGARVEGVVVAAPAPEPDRTMSKLRFHLVAPQAVAVASPARSERL